ncbi:MAG TPA: N-acetylneuraminate synthase family protein, partial [Candidatus Nanoarchaeia archaeon]|nr:N-acetylneuraminate synthase family protein [Candidatus Nanoarchaeia archaeon]
MKTIKIGGKEIGSGRPVFIVAEIGLNHNGDVDIAKKLIDVAVLSGCDAVKFQKRTPELCVPEEYKNVKRETPWGVMTYLEYRKRVEFGSKEYNQIDAYCREKGIIWFASPWDLPSIEFLKDYALPVYKVPSALLTHKEYLLKLKNIGSPIMLSSGMSDV